MAVSSALTRLFLRRRPYSTNSFPFPYSAAQHHNHNHSHPPSPSDAAANYQHPNAAAPHPQFNPQYPPPAADPRYPGAVPATTTADPRYPAAAAPSVDPQHPSDAPPNQSYYSVPNYHFNPQSPPAPPPSQSSSNYHPNPQFSAANNQFQFPNTSAPNNTFQFPGSSSTTAPPQRSYGFSSAEEAAAERRRRKRRLRIEPPLFALRPNPQTPPPNPDSSDRPRLPDSTSALVGPRLNLHNRVQSLIRAGDLDAASYIARQSVFQYIRPTVFTCNAIIAAMYRAKRYSDAKALFQYFFRQFNIIPNIVSYNNLIVSHCESNEVDEALKVYEYILENAPFSPSAVTYRHLTKGLIDAGRINDAVGLLRDMLNKGHGADSLVYNNVINGFLNLGELDKANELFDELKERCTVYDGVVNATFMDWFFNQGKAKEAMESYRDLMSRNYRMVPATRNVLLETLLRHGRKKEAWDLFHDMLDDHTPPTFQAVNSETVNMMVNECFKEGKVDEAIDVFKRSGKGQKSKPFQMDVAGFNNMMLRLCELDMMDEAEQYYKQLCDKALPADVNTYSTLIDAYIRLEKVDDMLEKFTKMVEAGLRVITPRANKWFGFLIEKARASDCLSLLSKMLDKEPKPDVTTCDVVIRGLIKEGNFDATTNFLREMTSHGIGMTASLKEFLFDAFEKLGRRAEIESILNRLSDPYSPQRQPYLGQQGPQRVERRAEMAAQGGRNPSMPWQSGGSSTQMSYANQHTGQTYQPQMTYQNPVPEQDAELPRIAGHAGS
ncbi:pentatricopeptide repeat-containing protein At1g10270-like [Andrographis paniculata]|uniref:pentatricopeptide repeat-containing protein At1g10270-like n=1 Tax=Andrographis paniculata TaxID=175694 RepID=UPI0021E760EF|nr:pentatricopeptide repeat-containing protein At1g10270-like [Andrographis paniculata]